MMFSGPYIKQLYANQRKWPIPQERAHKINNSNAVSMGSLSRPRCVKLTDSQN